MDRTLNGLLHSRKFWLAVVALAQTIIFQFVPDFPPAVWQAIDGVLVALIAAIAVEDLGSNIAERRSNPAERG